MPDSNPTMKTQAIATNPNQLPPAGGWLIALCIYLIAFYPTIVAFTFIQGARGNYGSDAMVIAVLLTIPFATIAGATLWLQTRIGLILTNAFFTIKLLAQLCLLPAVFGPGRGGHLGPISERTVNIALAFGSIAFAVGALLYLARSKRIAAAFRRTTQIDA